MDVKQTVREGYGKIAQETDDRYVTPSEKVGYGEADLAAVPEGTPSFGCGNPTALAGLQPGETVLDLGSGAGFDCFLAARAVGPTGRVIGVDMTPEMVARAQGNATRAGHDNVEFRGGDIENLPVASASVDVVISNCVINLAPNKGKVFAEAYRVLRPGGRLHVSDLVLAAEPPAWVRDDNTALVGCVAGAGLREDYLALVTAAGFTGLTVDKDEDATGWLSGAGLEREDACGCCGGKALCLPDGLVHSLTLTAHKPESMGMDKVATGTQPEDSAASTPEPRSETAPCGPGCDCGSAPPGRKAVKTVVTILALLGVVAALVYGRTGNTGQADMAAGNGAAFSVTQATQEPAAGAVAPGRTAGDTFFEPQSKDRNGTAKATARIGENLDSMNDLNKVAMSQDAVFVFIPVAKTEAVDGGTKNAVLAAQKALKDKGIALGLYTLSASSSDYSTITKQVPGPAIIVASKGRGMAVVTGDVTEAKLLQAFVASQRAGGCGCAPGGSCSAK